MHNLPTKKTAAKVALPTRDTAAKPAVPRVRVPHLLIPQGNGEYLVKPGRPQIVEEEIGCPEFAREAGLSLRYVNQLCDDGTIRSRRKSNRARSHYLIPRSELERFERLTKEER